MIPAETATKLARIIPRLASGHEGEVLNSVAAIGRVLASAGLDWHALAAAVEKAGGSDITLRGFGAEPFDWSGFDDFAATWTRPATGRKPWADREAPDAPSVRFGLPIWGVKKIEPWYIVAGHCLQIDWMTPKAFGGKSLTKTDKDRLRAVQGHGPVTNADADWIEGIVAKVHAARDAWRSRDTRAAA